MVVMGAVSCMTLVEDTFYYPLLPSNPSSDLSGLILSPSKIRVKNDVNQIQRAIKRKFDSLVTLTLTFDDLEAYIVRFVSSTSIHSTTDHVTPLSFTVNGRTYTRTYVRTDGRTFHLVLLGHLKKDDLNIDRQKLCDDVSVYC